MPKLLTVNGSTFNYPNAGEDPNWGGEAQKWASEVTLVLGDIVGDGDVLEDSFPILNDQVVNVPISKLAFNPNVVQAATIPYVIKRSYTRAVQIMDFTDVLHADLVNVSSGAGKYFTLNSAGDAELYYIWINESVNDVDPAPASRIAIEIVTSPSDSVIDIVAFIAGSISGMGGNFTVNTDDTGLILTVVCNFTGAVSVGQTNTIGTMDLTQPAQVTFGVVESGQVQITQDIPINNVTQWSLAQTAYGDAGVSLSITSSGQIEYQSSELTGGSYDGNIVFSAKALNV